MVTRIDLIYFNAGGGHRAAAKALQQVMQDRPWEVRLVNLVDMLDPQARFFATFHFRPEDLYNKLLANGLTLGMAQELKVFQMLIRLSHPALLKRLQAYWQRARPDVVVSLIPNFNRALCESLRRTQPQTPFMTVLTDMADHPPAFWIEPDQPQHVVCGTDHAAAQALAAGCAPDRVHRASGMILSPAFYQPVPLDRAARRRELGLPDDQAVGLVMFGGYGSATMKRIAARLPDTPLILMCGRNVALAQALRAMPSRAPRIVVDFTEGVNHWMFLADFFVGKPGPASLSEAIHMGLPVITTRNAWTMPQERWNTDWVRSNGLGVVSRSFRTVSGAVDELTRQLPAFQARVRQITNRAVFEVPDIIASIRSRRDITA